MIFSELNEVRIKFAHFLNTIILDRGILSFDINHILHFLTGGLWMFFLLKIKFFKKLKTKEKFLVVFCILVLWEVFELSFIVTGTRLFMKESNVNIFWDVALGMLGSFLVWKFKKK
ncbi:hypothetical protein FJZ20_00450 [Candidatus Pacearchaeota archaeon]|nr:hypothetical protein [Candidatus Pacearchaeota archaeon]